MFVRAWIDSLSNTGTDNFLCCFLFCFYLFLQNLCCCFLCVFLLFTVVLQSHEACCARFVCLCSCVRGLIHYLSNTGADNFFVLNCVVFCVLFICFYKIHCLMSESYVCMRSAVSLCACNVSCVRACVLILFLFCL